MNMKILYKANTNMGPPFILSTENSDALKTSKQRFHYFICKDT